MEAVRLRAYIRESLSIRIVKTLPAVAELREIPAHGTVLVGGAGEDVGEAAGGEVDCAFGGDADGAAYGGYPWAGLEVSS